jgi:hypothetical protein
MAVLCIVMKEMLARGRCELLAAEIAERAGIGIKLVSSTISMMSSSGLLTATKLPGSRGSNKVEITDPDWLPA